KHAPQPHMTYICFRLEIKPTYDSDKCNIIDIIDIIDNYGR
ncbi:hypothetical protein LCGC14_1364760, partial [marine sediment metagenome]